MSHKPAHAEHETKAEHKAAAKTGKLEDLTGKFISMNVGTVLPNDPDGTGCISVANEDGSHHNRSITKDTKITIDGEEATAADLVECDEVTVSGDPVTLVSVVRKHKKKAKGKKAEPEDEDEDDTDDEKDAK